MGEVESGLGMYLKMGEMKMKKSQWMDEEKDELNGVKETMRIEVVEKNWMGKGDQG